MKQPPSQKVQVNVEDRLTCSSVGVQDKPVSAISDAKFFSQLLSHQHHLAQQSLIFFTCVVKGRYVLSGHNQDMNGRLWIDVMEGDHFLVLIGNFALDLFGGDAAKNTTLHLTHLRLALTIAPQTTANAAGSFGRTPHSFSFSGVGQ